MSFPLSRKPISSVALLVFGAGLALTGVMTVWEASSEATLHRRTFEHAAEARRAAVQQHFNESLQGLTVVNRLFAGKAKVTERQFDDLATQLVELYPYIQAFSYIRPLAREQRSNYESALKKQGQGTGVTELRDGNLVPAGDRPAYHVIEYIAPDRPGNKQVTGLDVTPLPGREEALRRARTTGLPSATPLFDLLPAAGGGRAFAVVMPVYRASADSREAGHHDDAVAGFAVAVLRVQELMDRLMNHVAFDPPRNHEISIFVDHGTGKEMVYRTGKGSADEAPGDPLQPAGGSALTVTHVVNVVGLRWLIVSRDTSSDVIGMSASAWTVLGVGLSISLLLALYLQSVAIQASFLTRTNARLRRNIDTRKRIEEALRASEERFQRLARMSSDWYWEQDAEFRFTMVSGEVIFGDTPTTDLLGKTRADVPLEVDEQDFEEHLQVLKSHKPFSELEYRVRDKKGQVHWMSVTGEPLFGKDGEFIGYRGTGKDITARKEAEQALRQSQTELRELAAHQARVKEDERKRIAREIHDDLGQNLLALRIDVSLLESETRGRDPKINERIHELLSQVDNVVRSVRVIINDLRPPVLDLGLQCAVEWQVQQFRQRSGVSCTLEVDGGDIEGLLDEEAATSVFRILQESLSNVSRHAYATHVDIRLQRRFGGLVLEIADDGVGGFPGNMRKPRSFGLIGIRERVYSLGGEFRVASAPGKGTTLTITIPASTTSAAAA